VAGFFEFSQVGMPMIPLKLPSAGNELHVLCLGAHSDDIEIGAGATLLQWISGGAKLHIHWCVLSATTDRADEARGSAAAFLSGAASARVDIKQFRDGFFPAESEKIKAWFEALKSSFQPDLILTHYGEDAHQDHREVCRHTWSTFRDHLILEYEIPKWDGDLGRPNLYVPTTARVLERKIELLTTHFGTQRCKHWFEEDTFRAIARLRGNECRASERYAEAFYARKVLLA
jgi:LmbE family N-acetylglucosaminyl deacetylase